MKLAIAFVLLSFSALASDLRVINGTVYDTAKLPDICLTVGRTPEQFRANTVTVSKLGVANGKSWVLCDVTAEPLAPDPSKDIQIMVFNCPSKLAAGERLESCRALRVKNVTRWGASIAAYDCGVPYTGTNVSVAGK